MDEQMINCIISACCCEADCAEKKRNALAELLKKRLGHGPYEAHEIANFMLDTFDFAPKGFLAPLMEEAARLIKAGPYQG